MNRRIGFAIGGCVALPFIAVLGLLFAGGAVLAALVPDIGGSGTPGPVAGVPPIGQVALVGDDLLPWVPAGGFPVAFPAGECTYWAAKNHLVTWNGNAKDWAANAAAKGVAETSTPSVGAIVIWGAGGPYSGVGHVAIVVAVGGDRYTVSEMNYLGAGIVDLRTVSWPDGHVLAFIP